MRGLLRESLQLVYQLIRLMAVALWMWSWHLGDFQQAVLWALCTIGLTQMDDPPTRAAPATEVGR